MSHTIPEGVNRLVEDLLSNFRVLGGQDGVVVIGHQKGDKWLWGSAAEMRSSVFGTSWCIPGGRDRELALGLLHERAPERLKSAKLHPYTAPGAYLDDSLGAWVYDDGTHRVVIGPKDECHTVKAASARTHLAVNFNSGALLCMIGTLEEGYPGYPHATHNTSVVLHCPPGVQRNLIIVVERSQGMGVLGVAVSRSFANRALTIEPFPVSEHSYLVLQEPGRKTREPRVYIFYAPPD